MSILKKSKVLHGHGKPRIVIPEDEAFTNGTINTVNDKIITFSAIGEMNIGLINRQIISTNKFGSETRGKIIGYNSTSKKITIDKWNNQPSIVNVAVEIKNEVIDLPWTEEHYEWFTILFKPEVTLFYNKEKIIEFEGFYYNCILNYESFMLQETLASVQNIYNAKRKNNFIFIPRSDNETVFYYMNLTPETILELAQMKYYQGHKYVRFQFSGVHLLDGPNLRSTKDGISLVTSADGTIITDASGTGISGGNN